jgi:general secretion pathway protein K
MKKNKGVALIMALLVVSIVVSIAAFFWSQLQAQIKHIGLYNSSAQFDSDALAASIIAGNNLSLAYVNYQQKKILPNWPIVQKVTLQNGNVMTVSILPAAGLFNLNNLSQSVSSYLQVFATLIQTLSPQMNADAAMQIAQNTQLFITPLSPGQSDSSFYSTYQVPHQPFTDKSELLLVEGITPQLYALLAPFIIVLPSNNSLIDINAAPAEILAALLGNNIAALNAVLSYRTQNGAFTDISVFSSLPGMSTGNSSENMIQLPVSVDFPIYCQVTIEEDQGGQHFSTVKMLDFSPDKNTISFL